MREQVSTQIKTLPVTTQAQITQVATLAEQIWREHYTPIIGAAQVDYMLAHFQSPDAIKAQIDQGFKYFLAEVKGVPVGYAAVVVVPEREGMMLSKLYVRSDVRGRGAGQSLLAYAQKYAVSQGQDSLWLTVNKYNESAIEWYKHHGFHMTDAVRKPIGGGFFMDDFIMEKKLVSAVS